ncbi:MAG: PKD domain-containing protein, partial [Chloroflexota bacterium]
LGSSNTKTIPNYITVYAALTAGCSANVTETLVNQSVTFTASAAGGKPGYTYAWNFGDSGTSPAANPTHSFATSGNYTVALTVTDALGNTSGATVLVKVYKVGDATRDNQVNISDITYIEHIIMEDSGYDETTWADANQDGYWNALDITAVELIIIP